MKRIESTISYPLAARVTRVLKHVKDLESSVKEFTGRRLDNEMERILTHLKSDSSKLANTLERILFEHELVSYLSKKKIKEYHEIWENLSWFCEFLKKDSGVIIASIEHYFRGQPDQYGEKLGKLFSSLERLQENLEVTEGC